MAGRPNQAQERQDPLVIQFQLQSRAQMPRGNPSRLVFSALLLVRFECLIFTMSDVDFRGCAIVSGSDQFRTPTQPWRKSARAFTCALVSHDFHLEFSFMFVVLVLENLDEVS